MLKTVPAEVLRTAQSLREAAKNAKGQRNEEQAAANLKNYLYAHGLLGKVPVTATSSRWLSLDLDTRRRNLPAMREGRLYA